MKHELGPFEELWKDLADDAYSQSCDRSPNAAGPQAILAFVEREKRRRRNSKRVAIAAISLAASAGLLVLLRSNSNSNDQSVVAGGVPKSEAVSSGNSSVVSQGHAELHATQVPEVTSSDPQISVSSRRLRSRLVLIDEPRKEPPKWEIKTISDEEFLAVLPKGAKLVTTPEGKRLVVE
jgi:hypothetical protein